jgi:hypothetical protein
VSSNLETKPIQCRSEHYKAEKCLAELLVPGADSAAALDAGIKVSDNMAVAIKQFGEVVLNPTRNSGWNAGSRSTRDDFLTKILRVEPTIRDDPAIGEFVQERLDRSEVVPIPGDQMQPNRSAQAINDCGQLRVHPAFGFSNCLSGSTTGCVRFILMGFDVHAVNAARRTAGIVGEQGQLLRPKFTFSPTAEPSVNRRPRAELLWQIPPRQPGPKDEVHSTPYDSVVLGRPSATSRFGDISIASVIRSIFLSAPRADRAKPNDLI